MTTWEHTSDQSDTSNPQWTVSYHEGWSEMSLQNWTNEESQNWDEWVDNEIN